jgi:molybdopterin synthase catalytic subunit
MTVRIQTEDFDVGAEISAMRKNNAAIGAIASFVGVVRDVNEGDRVSEMMLEHYPGMTEKSIEAIVTQARGRWQILDALVVHRVGLLKPTDQIVLVIVASAHRGDAFAACEFIMDYLKTRAPFWKKEKTTDGSRWVDARAADDAAAERWRERKRGQSQISAGSSKSDSDPDVP